MTSHRARVLIAHQSTIPHYRVRFYELLEQMRPDTWSFDVVFDKRESINPRIYLEPVDWRTFQFPILDVPTRLFRLSGKRLIWQEFFLKARDYDVIITDTHLNNLTYPAVSLHRLVGRKRIFWGHFRDMNVPSMSLPKRLAESFKLWLLKRADACLAYTPGTARELESAGFPASRIFNLNNTIDIVRERERYLASRERRPGIRAEMKVDQRKVIVFVGRLIPEKQIEYLLQLFRDLHARDSSWHLFVVGTGPLRSLVEEAAQSWGSGALTYFGPVYNPDELAPILIASDIYLLTGMVGLAPLQAFCYDLPAVVFDVKIHSPEFEYLTPDNSVLLPEAATAAEFAECVSLLGSGSVVPRQGIYNSIKHLTMENMVSNFIAGVNSVIGTGAK